jgi:hypothetical protein
MTTSAASCAACFCVMLPATSVSRLAVSESVPKICSFCGKPFHAVIHPSGEADAGAADHGTVENSLHLQLLVLAFMLTARPCATTAVQLNHDTQARSPPSEGAREAGC